jgi:hypothetical protein
MTNGNSAWAKDTIGAIAMAAPTNHFKVLTCKRFSILLDIINNLLFYLFKDFNLQI